MEQVFQVSFYLCAFWILHALLDEIVPLTEGESASYLFDDEEKMKRYFLNWLFHFIDLFTALSELLSGSGPSGRSWRRERGRKEIVYDWMKIVINILKVAN
jgi:hypothetical protein